jgi:TPR repeat protein
MAVNYVESVDSDVGKKMLKTMFGAGHDLANLNVKDIILSKYNSVESLKEKAGFGQDWQAQAHLGMAYQHGIPELNIDKDFDSAIGWYESSIQNGNCDSLDITDLGTLLDNKGTVTHQRRAYELYMQTVNLGSVRAELNLAEMYRCGVKGVVDKDLEEAFTWYRRAAGEGLFNDEYEDRSFPSACLKGTMRNADIDSKFTALRSLHKYYMSGDCPERKPQPIKALYYLKKAAELGDTEAQKDLGLSYLTGESGQPKDLDKAKRWLGKAANGGDQEAKEVCVQASQAMYYGKI